MAEKIIMPKQGLQMTEGTITKWLKKEGDEVMFDEPLFEMETDKLIIEIPSTASGTLLKILKEEGETVPITEIIAYIGDTGEIIPDAEKNGSEKTEEIITEEISPVQIHDVKKENTARDDKQYSTPRARMMAEENGVDISKLSGTGPDGLIIERDVKSFSPIKATPLARKLAEQKKIVLNEITGTGARSKILKADVENIRKERLVPFTGMRKAVSENMMKSIHGMAQANHRIKVDMSESIRMREKLKSSGVKISYNDILVKVVSKALLDFPIVNSSYSEEGIIIKDHINIGLAVALEDGLIVPVIKDADKMSLRQISLSSNELINKALARTLKPDEYKGGTFTITNLGMYDINEFTAIINPPESAILAVGKIDRIPVAEGDDIIIKPIMVLSLTYDHRVIDGAPAALFLGRIKQLLQDPYLII